MVYNRATVERKKDMLWNLWTAWLSHLSFTISLYTVLLSKTSDSISETSHVLHNCCYQKKGGNVKLHTLYKYIYKKDFQHNLKKIYIYNTWKLVISSMKTARYSPTRTALIYFKMKTFIALDTRFKNWKYQWIFPSFIGHKIYISESVKWFDVNF